MKKIPTRLLVLQRLTALVEATVIERQGVPGTLADSVYRGRNILGEESAALTMLPVISILEAPRPDNAFFAGNREASSEDWTLLLCGLCEDDKENPNDKAYELHAAVQEQLSRVNATKKGSGSPIYPEHYLLGGLITTFSIEPPVVRPPEDKLSSKAFFFLPIRVGLASALSDPYTAVP